MNGTDESEYEDAENVNYIQQIWDFTSKYFDDVDIKTFHFINLENAIITTK